LKSRDTNWISAHQSQFLPWPPYFRKVALSNVFVWMDSVQFQRGQATSVQHRNKILTQQGVEWLSVAVQKSPLATSINHVRLVQPSLNERLWKRLESSYAKSSYWQRYAADLYRILCVQQYDTLDDLNYACFLYLLETLEVRTPIIRLSELILEKQYKTDLIIALCQKLKATHYVSGLGAKAYLESSSFDEQGMGLIFLPSQPPVYINHQGQSITGLSMIDMLMNVSKTDIKTYLYAPLTDEV